jgi:hypothetical protein
LYTCRVKSSFTFVAFASDIKRIITTISSFRDDGSPCTVLCPTGEWGDVDVGSIYVMQRGQGIGSFLSGLFRAVKPVLWSGARDFAKATLKALGNALRTGGKILTGIADDPTGSTHDIISKHVTESLQNLSGRMMSGRGRKRKKTTALHSRKRVKRSPKIKRKTKKTIKRDIFS